MYAPCLVEQPIKEHALVDPAASSGLLKRRRRRQRHEIDAGTGFLLKILHMQRQQCQACRLCNRIASADAQPVNILPSDIRVRADIDDVDPRYFVPQVIDGSRNHATCDQRLPQPDFVCDEESSGRVRTIEPIEDVIHCCALKILEPCKGCCCIWACAHFSTAFCAISQIGSQICRKSSLSNSELPGCFRSTSSSDATRSSWPGER